jgi:hypothetical protein
MVVNRIYDLECRSHAVRDRQLPPMALFVRPWDTQSLSLSSTLRSETRTS